MTSTNQPLPSFENPPLQEVVLGVQFAPVPMLAGPHLGVLWSRFRSRFPEVQIHAPLAPSIERFGVEQIGKLDLRLEFSEAPPAPRTWFLDKSGTELVQLQPDRFVQNWRRRETEAEYPRYPKLRSAFSGQLRMLAEFVEQEKLGAIQPEQCELTYVNHIVRGAEWTSHADLTAITPLVASTAIRPFLGAAENMALVVKYLIKGGDERLFGRLHVNFTPAFRNSDGEPMFILTMTARGAPRGEGIDGVLAFLDLAHEWVVRGFADVTTPAMHRAWRKIDAADADT